MYTINELLREARINDCSDMHLTADAPPIFRKDGKILFSNYQKLSSEEVRSLIMPLLSDKQKMDLLNESDVDFSYVTDEGKRNRVNIYRQKGAIAGAFRLLKDEIPSMEDLRLPPVLQEFCELDRGLVVVTGPTGSGKSTTLASMIGYINRTKKKHIITIEDPIEYVHTHGSCMVNQRELGADVGGFAEALRSSLREDPDVILVGEMRDLDTISAAITAAETGHLVLSTLHTTGASTTVDRIIDVFPQGQQQQIRTQLAAVLKAVISQQLLPKKRGGRVAAIEVLNVTDSIANLIRENKGHQIDSAIQTGKVNGMQSLDVELAKLVNADIISMEEALEKCMDYQTFNSYVSAGKRNINY